MLIRLLRFDFSTSILKIKHENKSLIYRTIFFLFYLRQKVNFKTTKKLVWTRESVWSLKFIVWSFQFCRKKLFFPNNFKEANNWGETLSRFSIGKISQYSEMWSLSILLVFISLKKKNIHFFLQHNFFK